MCDGVAIVLKYTSANCFAEVSGSSNDDDIIDEGELLDIELWCPSVQFIIVIVV